MQKNIVKWVGIAATAGPVLLIGGRLFKMAGSLVGTFGKVGKAIGSIGKKTKGMSAPLKEGSSVMSAAAKNALGFRNRIRGRSRRRVDISKSSQRNSLQRDQERR